MVKSIFSAAVAALALSAGTSAQLFPRNATTPAVGPTGTAISSSSSSSTGIVTTSSTNGTTSTSSTSTSTSSAAPASDPTFCPALSGEIYAGPLDVSYSISCDQSYGGVTFIINLSKRQSPTSLQDCLNVCSANTQCVAAAYDTNNPSCTYYSSLGSAFTANGIEFATVSQRGNSNSTSSSTSSAPYPTGNTTTPAGTGAPTGIITTSSSSSVATTSSSSSSSSSATPSGLPNDIFCPTLDGSIYVDGFGIQFLIQCGINHFGIIIDVIIAKRQAGAVTSLGDCLDQCAATTGCVGTAFNFAQGTCTLFSEIGAAYEDADVDFAVVIAPAATATPGQTLTSTLYSTTVQTISSCAPTVTDCPLAGGEVVVTEVIPVSSTEYICPTITSFPASPVACTACPYGPSTVKVYSTTVDTIYSCAPTVTDCPYAGGKSTAGAGVVTTTVTTCPAGQTLTTGGVTTVLTAPSVITSTVTAKATVTSTSGIYTITSTGVTAVATTVINYPNPTASVYASSSIATITGAVVTQISDGQIQATATGATKAPTTTSGVAIYTGAANSVGAGAGMAAVAAVAAFLL